MMTQFSKPPRSLQILAVGLCLSLAWSGFSTSAQAQTPDRPEPVTQETQPTPSEDSQPIRREQAPLPLSQVYQTPITQFEPPFSDVPADHWAYEAVTRLFYSGIVVGQPTSSGQPQF